MSFWAIDYSTWDSIDTDSDSEPDLQTGDSETSNELPGLITSSKPPEQKKATTGWVDGAAPAYRRAMGQHMPPNLDAGYKKQWYPEEAFVDMFEQMSQYQSLDVFVHHILPQIIEELKRRPDQKQSNLPKPRYKMKLQIWHGGITGDVEEANDDGTDFISTRLFKFSKAQDVGESRWIGYFRGGYIACATAGIARAHEARQQGFRPDLNLRQLKEEWDTIIKRVIPHVETLKSSVLSSTQTNLRTYVQLVHHLFTSSGEEDGCRLLVALSQSAKTHLKRRDLFSPHCIFRDDFALLNDPAMFCDKGHFRRNIWTGKVFATLTAKKTDVGSICKLQQWFPSSEFKVPGSDEIKRGSADLTAKIRWIHDIVMSSANDLLHVLIVKICDLGADQASWPDRQYLIGHFFVLAIGKEGVAIFFSNLWSTKEGESFSVYDWIKQGEGDIRSWQEFESWLAVYRTVEKHAVSRPAPKSTPRVLGFELLR